MTEESKLAQLREALDRLQPELFAALEPDFLDSELGVVVAAAKAHLTLLESSPILIRRDSEGEWPEGLHEAINNVEVQAFDGRGYSGASAAQVLSPDELHRILDALSESQAPK